MVEYTVSFSEAKKNYICISVTCNAVEKIAAFSLPVWAPGSYMIRDYSRHIVNKHVTVNGEEKTLRFVNKNSWYVSCCPKDKIVFSYTIYAWDWSVRTCILEEQFAHISGPAAFVRVLRQENCTHIVRWKKHNDNWECATAMTAHQEENTWIADNYDELIDHPMLMGNLSRFSWEVDEKIYHMSITPTTRINPEPLIRDLSKIITTQKDIFGSLPKIVNQYQFLVIASDKLMGGLEHRRSTSLICPHRSLQNTLVDRSDSSSYIDFLSLCSHEHFHTWWIKFFKPKEFMTYDLDREQYTSLLWLFEGLTSYYGDLVLVRSGLLPIKHYLQSIANKIQSVESYEGYNQQTASESSFDAWTKYYRPTENRLNSQVSYYDKGELIALYTDCFLILESNGRYSLDNVLRELWNHHHADNCCKISENSWYSFIHNITGIDVYSVVSNLIHHHNYAEWETIFNRMGIKYQADQTEETIPYWGTTFTSDQNLIVDMVIDNSSAITAGISSGDKIIAIDELECTKQSFSEITSRVKVGQKSTVHFVRQGLLRTGTITWLPSPAKFGSRKIEISDQDNKHVSTWLKL
ncbi:MULTISPECIES: M61 family metallopeptidase [Candidatus Ichthyocystis]|uniref:Putative peptidase n=1 Tax=Candidatus Ichthyocystis hellenicum TaxID=1561003 RepID=A0A0S4M5T4_9BURK|nr:MULTISPECIES: M61 family metallopeptidase [Ichthyocystis]CUT17613.1 putative peptidase [Candidatus Ichthyocystis hellenicum]